MIFRNNSCCFLNFLKEASVGNGYLSVDISKFQRKPKLVWKWYFCNFLARKNLIFFCLNFTLSDNYIYEKRNYVPYFLKFYLIFNRRKTTVKVFSFLSWPAECRSEYYRWRDKRRPSFPLPPEFIVLLIFRHALLKASTSSACFFYTRSVQGYDLMKRLGNC